ncbi:MULTISPECIES: outer membrane protein transport protein [Pseudomonas]|uniref:Outer membrane protein transport protein n=2 Tax=Pseudomonas TaxID=286 RepID=A0A7Y8GA51_9PSED|nr:MULTISPECIES: outer membrane protein transport protein [Pseudomonas]NWF07109.1 outer membrane protein transport protein [Pseudomonas salomonii]
MNKSAFIAAAVVILCTQKVTAGGFDGPSVGISPIFEPGRYVEMTYSRINPKIRGTDNQGRNYGNITPSLDNVNGAIKFDVNDTLAVALLSDEPYQRDTVYRSGAPRGLTGVFKSRAWTLAGKYKLNPYFSVYGGPVYQTLDFSSDAPKIGYSVRTNAESAYGFMAGLAYEIPQSPTRVTFTYRSQIDHHMKAREFGERSTFEQKTPQSLTLEAQAPVSKNIVLFGSMKWTEWSAVEITPPILKSRTGSSLRNYKKNTFRTTLGASYGLTPDAFLSVWASHEPDKEPDFSSIAPTDGSTDIGVGLTYNLGGGIKIRPSVSYRRYGDISDPVYGDYKDNFLTFYSLKVGYDF